MLGMPVVIDRNIQNPQLKECTSPAPPPPSQIDKFSLKLQVLLLLHMSILNSIDD